MGMHPVSSLLLEEQLLHKKEILRPGVVRISFAYFLSEEEVDFLVRAIEFVAKEAWRLLPLYVAYTDSGVC